MDISAEVSAYMRTCGAKHVGDSGTLTGTAGNMSNVDLNLKGDVSMYVLLNEQERKQINNQEYNKTYKQEEINYIINNLLYNFSPTLPHFQEMAAIALPLPISFFKYYQLSLDYDFQKQFNKDNFYMKFRDVETDEMKRFIQNSYNDIYDDVDVVIQFHLHFGL